VRLGRPGFLVRVGTESQELPKPRKSQEVGLTLRISWKQGRESQVLQRRQEERSLGHIVQKKQGPGHLVAWGINNALIWIGSVIVQALFAGALFFQ
jgi:hypothetical protein